MVSCYIDKVLQLRPNTTSFEDLQAEVIKRNALAISILCVIFLLGLPANAIMLHIFRTAFKKSSYRLFSMWLASFGLINVLVTVPMTLWLFLWEMDRPSEIQCKVGFVVSSSLVISCHIILFVIAIERYRKVFHSFQWQIQEKEINFYNVMAMVVAVMAAAPHAVFVGNHVVPTGIKSQNATFCFVDENYENSNGPPIYYIILNVISFLITVSIVIMYGRIIHAIRHYKKLAQTNVIFPEYDENKPVCFASTTRIIETRRSTLTLFVSALSFILTTFPFSITALTLLLKPDFLCNNTTHLSTAIRATVCTLLLNTVLNPCIYFFADVHYRDEVKHLWHKMKSRNPRERLE